MNDLLKDAYEFHYHTMPDICLRKSSDIEYAKRLQLAQMAGGVIKCHWGDTSARAALLNEMFPQMCFYGGITLNSSVGGVNPKAVEYSARMGGKFVWFPTLEAYNWASSLNDNRKLNTSAYYTVLNEKGQLTCEALEVLDIAEKNHMVVGTGHLSSKEGMAIVRMSAGRAFQVVLTHCENPLCQYSIAEQQQAVELGAICEHSFYSVYTGSVPIEKVALQIRAVSCDNVIIDTDFGQPQNPHSDEGIALFANQLMECGFSVENIRKMICSNPERLLCK